jgi:hypothetical protein
MRIVHRINSRFKDSDGHILIDAANRSAKELEHPLGSVFLQRAMTDNKAARNKGVRVDRVVGHSR